MEDTHTPTAPSSSSFSSNGNLPMFYYGLVVVGTAAVLLALYNLIIIRWCAQRQDESRLRHAELAEVTAGRRLENPNGNLLSSFEYKKESNNNNCMVWQDQDIDPSGGYECAVCLSVFEDGEEVRQLPRCKHSFHAPCIDMWLNSHFDCPLCRATINPSPLCHQGTVANSLQNSGQGLPDVEIPV